MLVKVGSSRVTISRSTVDPLQGVRVEGGTAGLRYRARSELWRGLRPAGGRARHAASAPAEGTLGDPQRPRQGRDPARRGRGSPGRGPRFIFPGRSKAGWRHAGRKARRRHRHHHRRQLSASRCAPRAACWSPGRGASSRACACARRSTPSSSCRWMFAARAASTGPSPCPRAHHPTSAGPSPPATPTGNWCQRAGAVLLHAGANHIDAELADDDLLRAEPAGMAWESPCWNGLANCPEHVVRIMADTLHGLGRPPDRGHEAESSQQARIEDLAHALPSTRTGERAEWRFLPQPFPHNPYEIPRNSPLRRSSPHPTAARGAINAFSFWQGGERARRRRSRGRTPQRARSPSRCGCGSGQSGSWRVHLVCRWARGDRVEVDLPPLEVKAARPGISTHVSMPRIATASSARAGRWVWPIGLNIRSVFDLRDRACTGTKVTPDRGTLAYDAYLPRASLPPEGTRPRCG